jgi:hypothetical protein
VPCSSTFLLLPLPVPLCDFVMPQWPLKYMEGDFTCDHLKALCTSQQRPGWAHRKFPKVPRFHKVAWPRNPVWFNLSSVFCLVWIFDPPLHWEVQLFHSNWFFLLEDGKAVINLSSR